MLHYYFIDFDYLLGILKDYLYQESVIKFSLTFLICYLI
jgi:hypothetical protein